MIGIWSRRTGRPISTLGAVVSLVAAAAVTISWGTTPASLLLAGIAVILFARDEALGPLGAAAVVILTLPYDRAANGYLPRIGTIPVRPQDIAVVVGLALSVPAIRWRRPRGGLETWLLVIFLAVGVWAVLAGFAGGNDARDILRDARWWFLYGSGLVMLFLPPSARAQVVRGVLFGAVAFAAVVIVTSIAPSVPGGLRARAMEFDVGLLRLQYGNSLFLLFPLAWTAAAWIRGRTVAIAPLALVCVAIMLSLTRTLMLVSVAVILLALLASLVDRYAREPEGRRRLPLARMGAAVMVVPLALGLALAITSSARIEVAPAQGTSSASAPPAASAPPVVNAPAGEDPFGRITFENAKSGFRSISAGRMKTYQRALEVIAVNPVLGSGMGTTVAAPYAFGGEAFGTPNRLPNVDNAYLTAGMKGGVPAMVILGLLLTWPALRGLRYLRGRNLRIWWLPAWLGILVLTMTQSFATTGYGPFLLGMLVIVFGSRPSLGRATSRAQTHE